MSLILPEIPFLIFTEYMKMKVMKKRVLSGTAGFTMSKLAQVLRIKW